MKAIDEIQPKVSRHLAQLRRCDLLVDRRQGQWVFYRINPALPDWAKTVLTQTLESNQVFLAKNLNRLNKMGDRPARAQACLPKSGARATASKRGATAGKAR
jgi:ArsR family transcriptional regulator, arsenate/arsenite/antimonite-responsive transcriptional repressor